MAGWNGSGTFSRNYDWTDDAAAGIDIEASRFDTEHDTFVTGINTCLTKDGQNSPTANLPMGGNKHTGAASGTSSGEYAIIDQLTHGDGNYVADTGSADTYAISPSPAIGAYSAGQAFLVKVSATNTGAATLNVNSKGATAIKKKHDQALEAGDLEANGIYLFVYDGTNFQLVSAVATMLDDSDVVDEDDMSSDSADLIPTQQSTKAYVDNELSGALTDLLIVEDRKATTTDGGTASASTWSDRDLNTVVYNGITSASVSATSGEITLPAGTYELEGSAPAYEVERHQARLYNVTDAGVVTDVAGNDVYGTSEVCDDSASGSSTQTRSFLRSVFTLAAAKTLKLQHWVETTNSTDGFGESSGSGGSEIYSQLRFRKIA